MLIDLELDPHLLALVTLYAFTENLYQINKYNPHAHTHTHTRTLDYILHLLLFVSFKKKNVFLSRFVVIVHIAIFIILNYNKNKCSHK